MSTHCSLVSEHCFMYLSSIFVQASVSRADPRYNPSPMEIFVVSGNHVLPGTPRPNAKIIPQKCVRRVS